VLCSLILKIPFAYNILGITINNCIGINTSMICSIYSTVLNRGLKYEYWRTKKQRIDTINVLYIDIDRNVDSLNSLKELISNLDVVPW
jgi:hypothetical protein